MYNTSHRKSTILPDGLSIYGNTKTFKGPNGRFTILAKKRFCRFFSEKAFIELVPIRSLESVE